MPEQNTVLPLRADSTDSEILEAVVNHYHSRLHESPQARAYLHKRSINNADASETFRIGFVDRTLGPSLPLRDTRAGGEMRRRLKTLGVVKDTGHEIFRGHDNWQDSPRPEFQLNSPFWDSGASS